MEASLRLSSTIPSMKNFVLTDKLGSGTYATVYKAYRKVDREIVAIKCIERKRLTKVSMENLLTEIQVMKDLDHRHIVKLKDFEWSETHIFLIMEYCRGGDLSCFIRSRTRLPESTARVFLRQLALALQFLRQKGIAHMDLKPQNLLLTVDRKAVLKVGDFGMAQHMSASDYAESFRGSPLYMAPEIILGQKYDAKVDLWSVGVILYEAVFGMAPFASRTLSELGDKVFDQRPVEIPLDPPVSGECRHLLKSLLQRDPDMRISFEEFFKHSFIDLEHMPSVECLAKARQLVMHAVKYDNDNNTGRAMDYYCQALDYFIPALEYEDDHSTKEALHQKIEQYVDRAEYLKSVLREKRPMLQHKAGVIERMQDENPRLKAVFVKARLADECESRHDYRKALDLYQDAVSILLTLIEDTTSKDQRKTFKMEAEVFLERAEEVAHLNRKPPPKVRVSASSGESSESSVAESRCKIQ